VPAGDGREAVLHAGFFVGNQAFYRELREMPRDTLDLIAMTAISFTNTLGGDQAAKRGQRSHARFINTAMVVTLLGAASSDQLEDGRVVSGAGGQHDLVAMAHALEGARSIIGVRSTRRSNRRTSANIVWRYANATVPRQLRDIVVSEYGVADLRGKSDRDTIAAMLEIADSAFQAQLISEAQRAGKLEPTYRVPHAASSNRAERITAALLPARRDGLLPPFPLGTEMTEAEQALTGPLTFLRSAAYGDLLRVLAAGFGGQATPRERAALNRLSLASAATLRERALRALVLGALRRS
jgi:acyl-CoA hydrolase